jgi:hypothetical protein
MKSKDTFRTPSAIMVMVATLVLVWFLVEGDRVATLSEEASTSRHGKEDREGVLSVSQQTQAKIGVTTVELKPLSYRETLRAYGTVLQLQNLVQLQARYIQEKNKLERAQAQFAYSKKEYERLKGLNVDEANVSDKRLEEGEANWRADEANLRAAQEAMSVLEGSAQLEWGAVIAQWLFENAPSFQRFIHQEDALVQLTLAPDQSISPAAKTISLRLPDESLVPAKFLSLSPRTDPRIQGISFFYIAPVRANLLSGMNVAADLPVGPPMKGVFVPDSALVWRVGAAWVYVQRDETHFVRLRVHTDYPVKDGYFVLKGFEPGVRVVVKGASLLMSAEFLPSARTGEGD